jgi:hypothetical protein
MAGGFPKGLRARGGKLEMLIKRPGLDWRWEPTGLAANEIAAALKVRKTTQAIIDSGHEAGAYARSTVDAYAKRWIADRRSRGLRSVDDDESRLRLHVLNYKFESGRRFGAMFMDEVRPMHARAIIRAAVDKGLAPRTVINVHSIGKSMFADAVPDEVIQVSPWAVPKKEIPKKRDKTPSWRAGAKFSLAEIRELLWAPEDKVPWDRRMLYALMYFGAMRFGEAAARRWGDRVDQEPMRALHIHSAFSTRAGKEQETKTESVRFMPEHPTLTTLLNEWKLGGWARFYGRLPTAEDLIVPSRRMVFRRKNHSLHKLHEDLARLNLRPRRQHDLRRSFIGHAVDAGATRDRLRPGTHGLGTSILEMYDSPEWAACCEHVKRLRFPAPGVDTTKARAKKRSK